MIDERESKIASNSVFDCHLSAVGLDIFSYSGPSGILGSDESRIHVPLKPVLGA